MNSYFAPYAPHDHGVPMTDVVIRVGTPDDCAQTGALLAAREGLDAATCTAQHARRLGDDDHHLLVAARGADVLAFAWVSHLTPVADGGRNAPDGWYLSGLVVSPTHRRRGLGRRLTAARIAWVLERADDVHFVVSGSNQASRALHAELGFEEVATDFSLPGVVFGADDGILCRLSRRADAEVVDLAERRVRAG